MDQLDSSQYDALVAENETSLDLPSRRCTGVNFFANLGDMKGLKILDLTCQPGLVSLLAWWPTSAREKSLSLNYAGNQAMMDFAFQNIAKYLKDGGRFVSIIPSKASHGSRDQWPGLDEQNGWYGAGKRIIEEVEDGYRARTIFFTNPPLEFDNSDLKHSVYFRAAKGAGLEDVKTDAKEKIPSPFKGGEDQAYWDKYLERPLFDIITATK
ncbi:hypothetical protein DHEL01_v206633 [Diaporthe helianthi]|uniref:Uncharacterized protein n=1 Tax=Diaporthe helianthi TaxID=158607 RepID=A0A2P5HXJ6_DIAHE|nr:hypothetical protein DHEL01_v206633 [Diaporthe helianthi]